MINYHFFLIYETVQKKTEQINLLIRFSIASRAGVGVGVGVGVGEYSVFSWFLQQWKS